VLVGGLASRASIAPRDQPVTGWCYLAPSCRTSCAAVMSRPQDKPANPAAAVAKIIKQARENEDIP
jgi:hypothetical protein